MRVLWLSAVVLVLDQITKWVVLHNMVRYESIPLVGDWLKFTYTRNPGMAFGITFGPPWTVTLLAIVATVLICGYLWTVRRSYEPFRYSLALILGGALGNIIDRVFYGVIYEGAGWFQGHVVDFVHVDLYNGWVNLPLLGPRYVSLFPIWNVADMAIVCGVVGFMAFQGGFHRSLVAAAEADKAARAGATLAPGAAAADGVGGGEAPAAPALTTSPEAPRQP